MANWFLGAIDRVMLPEFTWDDVQDCRAYLIRWRDSEHLYATRAAAELAYEWLAVTGAEPLPIRAVMAYRLTPRPVRYSIINLIRSWCSR